MRSFALRHLTFTSACSLLVALAATEASAAPKHHDGPKQSSSQFTLRRDEAGGADAVAARAKARAGDCEGALSLFDLAITNTIEPTLRRDRGLCHEKLGHPYPAIDDYRAYLVARPDAADSDQIRDRLAKLEEQTGQGGPSSRAVKEEEGASGSASASAGGGHAEASVSLGGSSSSSSSSSSARHKGDEPTTSDRDYDDYVAQEKIADAAETSPLRYGEGWVLGPYLHIPRYFFGDGGTSDLAYSVGAHLAYATSSSVMVVAEAGYAAIGTSGQTSSAGGPLLALGAELRLPISRYATNQILLGAAIGFERYVVSGTHLGVDYLPLRAKLAFRHCFGPALALDLGVDGGPAYGIPDGGGSGKLGGVAGGSAAFLLAF
jgi:hypothetical protein